MTKFSRAAGGVCLGIFLLGGCNGGGGESAGESATTGDSESGTASEGATTSTSGNSATGTTTAGGGSESESATGGSTSASTTSSGSTSASTSDSGTTTDPGTTSGEPSTGVMSDSDTDTGTDSATDSATTADSDSDSDTDPTTTGGDTGVDPPECGSTLKATIRDFKIAHPDMQSYCCGVVPGLVKADLGPDGKPVFNQAGNPKMLTDAARFNEWYNNVKDVNIAVPITLTLQEIMPGVYSYSNNNFFPVDGQGFGNEGNSNNFHFTTEIHSFFQYSGGETFTFQGDDDVWVFINKKLVIDLGGVHGVSTQSVNLDSLGLEPGNVYPIEVFHAERHTVQSNFRIDTTICSIPQ